MDKFDIFIKNIDMSSTQYTASRQRETAKILKKGVFKVVISANIPNNIQIFNSHFVDEIKHAGIDKAYKKSRLII